MDMREGRGWEEGGSMEEIREGRAGRKGENSCT